MVAAGGQMYESDIVDSERENCYYVGQRIVEAVPSDLLRAQKICSRLIRDQSATRAGPADHGSAESEGQDTNCPTQN